MVPVPVPADAKHPIVDLAPLAAPVTKLIEVVAQGTGTLYKPMGTILQAMADSKANLILVKGDIEVSELRQRAANRLAHVEIERQRNLDAIVEKAYAALPEKVAEKPVGKDWTTHFFSAAQDVSDQDMQAIWARVLAGEVAEPGSTSRRTLEFLKTMSKHEAEIFTALLSVCFEDLDGWHFYVEDDATMNALRELVPNLNVQQHMIDIGLLSTEPELLEATGLTGWTFCCNQELHHFVWSGVVPAIPPQIRLPGPVIGLRYFTSIGQQLSRVAPHKTQAQLVSPLSASLDKQFKVHIKRGSRSSSS